jgi:hypothetical protein
MYVHEIAMVFWLVSADFIISRYSPLYAILIYCNSTNARDALVFVVGPS